MTRANALEVVKVLKKTLEDMLIFSKVDNITVSAVVQTLEKFAGIMNKEDHERVAQNVFATMNNLLKIEKSPLRKVKEPINQQLGKYIRNIKLSVLINMKIRLSLKRC